MFIFIVLLLLYHNFTFALRGDDYILLIILCWKKLFAFCNYNDFIFVTEGYFIGFFGI